MRVLDILRPPLVAIDAGTATIRVAFASAPVRERRALVREELHGTVVTRPVMRGGVVADIAGVASVIGELLEGRGRAWRRPGAVVCAPTDVSAQERDALVEAVAAAGASVVAVVPEPLAAAVGEGVDVASEYATAVIDIGDGVTDFAVFRNGAIVFSAARRIGCGTLRAAIHDWVELRQHRPGTLSDDAADAVVRTWCRTGGDDVLEALLEPVLDDIAAFVGDTFRGLPDALAAEILESGVHVTGGGANLDRLVLRIEERTGLPFERSRQPLTAVIRGAAEMLRHFKRAVS